MPPSPRELVSFRRTFTLLILLVVVPSAGLSGFGVLAIINERAAVEKRVQAAWQERLERLGVTLVEAVHGARLVNDHGTVRLRTPEGRLLNGVPFLSESGTLTVDDAMLERSLRPLAGKLSSVGDAPLFFPVPGPRGSRLAVVQSLGGRAQGLWLEGRAFEPLLEAHAPPREADEPPVHFELRSEPRDPSAGLMGRLANEVANVREAALVPPFAQLQLGPPLEEFRLVVLSLGEDPVAQRAVRNRALYGVLLGVFYLTLALGVVSTARSLYRQVRLNRLKTDFLSLVSHELRTPLTSIRMFIETLALGRVENPAQTQEVLALLSSETERLSQMIERVLDWARIESGRKEYLRERLPVLQVVERALGAFRTQRLGGPLDLHTQVDPVLPWVDVDKDAIAGALLNLLHNAWKYSGGGKPIEVRVRKEGKGVAIDVTDQGPGIPLRERKKVFERFYRVDSLLTRRTEGSGLGLSIAKRIVEAHGGRVTLKSDVGQGSTFTLHLPGAKPSPSESEENAT